jgi:SAM-dependent methyltransferase
MPFDNYFDRRSGRFARFYRSRPIARLLGRGALFDRLDFAVERSAALGALRVVDIGCGSGPLIGPLADRGVRVSGNEPAARMVELAERAAAECGGLVDVTRMGWEQLAAWHTGEPFDVAIALGVFDYVPNAGDLLATMGDIARHSIASFPRPGLRTNLRKLRYGARGVSVYGYSPERIESLARASGMETVELAPLGRAGYILLARNASDRVRGGPHTAHDPARRP